jgi:hypothetical protein
MRQPNPPLPTRPTPDAMKLSLHLDHLAGLVQLGPQTLHVLAEPGVLALHRIGRRSPRRLGQRSPRALVPLDPPRRDQRRVQALAAQQGTLAGLVQRLVLIQDPRLYAAEYVRDRALAGTSGSGTSLLELTYGWSPRSPSWMTQRGSGGAGRPRDVRGQLRTHAYSACRPSPGTRTRQGRSLAAADRPCAHPGNDALSRLVDPRLPAY